MLTFRPSVQSACVAGRLTTAGQGTVTMTSPMAASAVMASTGLGTFVPADDASVST